VFFIVDYAQILTTGPVYCRILCRLVTHHIRREIQKLTFWTGWAGIGKLSEELFRLDWTTQQQHHHHSNPCSLRVVRAISGQKVVKGLKMVFLRRQFLRALPHALSMLKHYPNNNKINQQSKK
jgi:hypothetical protein